MSTIDLKFSEYVVGLVNLYKVRAEMNGDQARRYVIDCIDDVLAAFEYGTPFEEVFQEDVNAWVN